MPKDKDRAINPAAAQRKAEKQRALKKNKAAVTAQRNERLAHRNPERLQRQIDELKEVESSKGQLSQRDKSTLSELERDVARIRKAKEALGDKAPQSRHHRHESGRDEDGRRGQVLGKRERSPGRQRRRFDGHGNRNGGGSPSSSSDTDEDVRDIPMPRDTPPPIPSRRRNRHGFEKRGNDGGGESERDTLPERPPAATPAAPTSAQVVYESKPVVRDLQREAAGFVPNVVKRKLEAVKGGVDQRLMEEEELDRLEREGYGITSTQTPGKTAAGTEVDPVSDKLDEEMNRFSNDVRKVQIEEVEDEGN